MELPLAFVHRLVSGPAGDLPLPTNWGREVKGTEDPEIVSLRFPNPRSVFATEVRAACGKLGRDQERHAADLVQLYRAYPAVARRSVLLTSKLC